MGVHIYLSPHLDDGVYSCGGLMARQSACGEAVAVVTVCAGDPGEGPLSPYAELLHERWQNDRSVVGARRAEDRMACGRLGASVVHLPVPDAIYRRSDDGQPLYASEEAIFGTMDRRDEPLVRWLARRLVEVCPEEAWVYCPVAIGGHVDHRLSRAAAERLERQLWYYCDLPYAAREGAWPDEFAAPDGLETVVPLAAEEIQAWADAAAEYHTQLSTFWPHRSAILEELRAYHDAWQGLRLWAPL